jgi:hypothetical protein
MDLSTLRRGPKLALFAVVLVASGGVGAAIGAATPEQRTGGPGHDMPMDDPATTTTVHDMTSGSMEDHG